MTFIQHAGISQRIGILHFRFTGVKEHNFCYILCNFGEDQSTNPRDYEGSFCTFWCETAKIDISYQLSQQVLDRTSTFQHCWAHCKWVPKRGYKIFVIFHLFDHKPHMHAFPPNSRGCRRTVITCDKFFGDRLWDVDSVEGWKARDVILISNARCNKYKNDNSLSCRVSEWQNNDNNFKAAFQWVKITCKRHNKTSKLQQTILYSDKILACT